MKIYAAINKIQKELNVKGITKTHKNALQGYSFRGIDDIYNALSPLLATYGVCILPRVLGRTQTERASKSGGAMFSVVVEAEFDFVCSEDGSKHTVKTYGEAMDSSDKATNKALSAAYKYACIQAFAIPTEGDNDTDSQSPEVIAEVQREPIAGRSYPLDKPLSQSVPTKTPEASGFQVARFYPDKVEFVDGKGKGAGKIFSEIYRPDGVKFGGTEIQGEIAQSACNATPKKEIIVHFETNGKFYNAKKVILVEEKKGGEVAPPDIEEVPF